MYAQGIFPLFIGSTLPMKNPPVPDCMPDGSEYCSYLHDFGALFEEWLVLQWAKEEQQRLTWVRNNQATIRADLYQNVLTQSTQSTQASQVGRRVVLPSSFTGGPRFMTQLYHDGMAIVRSLGKADLFITFTASWFTSQIFARAFFLIDAGIWLMLEFG